MIDEDSRLDSAAYVASWTPEQQNAIQKQYRRTIYNLYPPDGWKFTGEFRTGTSYETYLDSCTAEPTACHLDERGDIPSAVSARLILEKIKQPKISNDVVFKQVVVGLYAGIIDGKPYHLELIDDRYKVREDRKLIDYLTIDYDDGPMVSIRGDVPRHIWLAAKEGK